MPTTGGGSGAFASGKVIWREASNGIQCPQSLNPTIPPKVAPDLPATYYAIVDNGGTTTDNLGGGTYRITKVAATSAYDSAGVGTVGIAGNFVLRISPLAYTNDFFLGMNSDPLADNNFASIDYAFVVNGVSVFGATLSIYESGSFIVGSIGVSPGSYAWIWRIGTSLNYGTGPDLATAQASPVRTVTDSSTLYFDSAFFAQGSSADVTLYDYPPSSTLSPSLLPTDDTIFTPVLSAVYSLTPSLFTNSGSIFAATVTPGAVQLAPGLFTNSQTFPGATVGRGVVNLAPSLFTNTQSFLAPSTKSVSTLAPALVSIGQTFFAPTVGRGAVNLVPSLFTNGQSYFAPAVAPGAVTLTPALFTDGDTFFSPVVTSGTGALLPGLFTNAESFFGPAVTTRTALTAGLWINSQAFFGPTVRSVRLFFPRLLASSTLFSRPKIVATQWQGEPNAAGAWDDEAAPAGTWTNEPANEGSWTAEAETSGGWADEPPATGTWS